MEESPGFPRVRVFCMEEGQAASRFGRRPRGFLSFTIIHYSLSPTMPVLTAVEYALSLSQVARATVSAAHEVVWAVPIIQYDLTKENHVDNSGRRCVQGREIYIFVTQ